jgi:gliding motility-associated lipoprotein GldK
MIKTKKFLLVLLCVLAGCGPSEQGQLLGVQNRPTYRPVVPYGMVYIPSGTLHIGQSDQDINNALVQRTKSISLQGFYMDQTAITNNQYRQFVEYVKDSVARKLIGGDYLIDEGEPTERINWHKRLDWSAEENQDALSALFYPDDQQLLGRKEIDVSKLVYASSYIDYREAARKKDDQGNNNRDPANRPKFIKTKQVPIYPDTLCWVHDYAYSYNEPMTRNYFWHPAFDNYPVVGVNWNQATAFCNWRWEYWNSYRISHAQVAVDDIRLPTEAEWEYAARGGHDESPYPWGGPYMRNKKGCILANFKPGRGDYSDDGGLYTVKADAYFPNDYGLYCMAGNVAEWTSNAYDANAYAFEHDLNPDDERDAKDSDPEVYKRKVIRGGSWKDISYFCQVSTRSYEYQDTAKCYIGFRCVETFLGRSISDFGIKKVNPNNK